MVKLRMAQHIGDAAKFVEQGRILPVSILYDSPPPPISLSLSLSIAPVTNKHTYQYCCLSSQICKSLLAALCLECVVLI